MNDKIAKTMLGLCIGYLSVFYVLKFFFPELLLQSITSPTIIRLGNVMSQYKFLEFVFKTLSTIIVIYLFTCASSGKFKFTKIEFVYILVGAIICRSCIILLPNLYTHTSTAIMFLVAMLCKGKLAYSAISFTLHGYLSIFLFEIRGFEAVMLKINNISGFMLAMESYFWLILLAILFNIKERKENGRLGTPLPQQEHRDA